MGGGASAGLRRWPPATGTRALVGRSWLMAPGVLAAPQVAAESARRSGCHRSYSPTQPAVRRVRGTPAAFSAAAGTPTSRQAG